MGEKKRSIQVRQQGGGAFQVYTDIAARKLRRIDGVVSVDDTSFIKARYFTVYVDQRWDERDVIEEIGVLQQEIDGKHGAD